MSPDDLRTDGGLSITVEEFERLKQANSSTPPEQRQRCPECGGADPVRKSNRGNQSQKPGQYRCRRPGCYAHFDEPVTGYESAEAVVEDREESQELVTDGGHLPSDPGPEDYPDPEDDPFACSICAAPLGELKRVNGEEYCDPCLREYGPDEYLQPEGRP